MKGFLFILGLIIAGLLAYHYVPRMAQVIENDVTENVTAALIPNNLPADVQIKVEGRDVALNGTVTSQDEKQGFVNLAQGVKGVRSVQNNLLVDETLVGTGIEIDVDTEPTVSDPFGDIVDEDFVEFDPLDEEPLFDFLGEEENDDVVVQQEEEIVVETEEVQFIEGNEPIEPLSEPETFAEEPVIEEVATEEAAIEEAEIEEPLEILEEKPAQSSAECQATITQLIAGKKANFETGVSKIEKESLPLLDSIAQAMAGCSEMALHIHGHTDNVGDAQVNRKLSHERAKSVGLYLLKQGVTQRIKIFGHGADEPIADNETEEGRLANRRIEFTTSDLEGSIATDDVDTVKTIKTLRSINTNKIIAK